MRISYCTIEDKNYPNALKGFSEKPVVLYYKGEIGILNANKNIAIVGGRNCSFKGKELSYRTGRLLAGEGMTIVNGLVLGCDTEALRGALDVQGKCVVVMLCGLDNIQPKSNRGMAQRIIDAGGCILSEYPIGAILNKYQYVERDRLQSSISQGVLVIEAEMKSGTMHTTEFAIRQYKRLACYYHKLLEMSSGNRNTEKFRALQGTYPVISLSFASVKETNYQNAHAKICQLIASEYARCAFLLEGYCLTEQEKEVFAAMDEYGLEEKDKVKSWYDDFIFGEWKDIYNPCSILNYLDKGKVATYWANISSNSLAGKLIREGSPDIKVTMEDLLHEKTFHTIIDEQIVFNQLNHNDSAVWSLLLAGGYLGVERFAFNEKSGKTEYDLKLTNKEVRLMFEQMIDDWFLMYTPDYNTLIKALLQDNKKAMNTYMNRVALATFSNFDIGRKPSGETEPERFYYGFVLGLMVDLSDRYEITSNRESGCGDYSD